MQVFIDANTPVPVEGQEGRLKVGPLDALTTPRICFQLANAVEWLHHFMPEELVRTCLPAGVTKYSGDSHDTAAHDSNVRKHVKNVTRRTIDRAIILGASFFRLLLQKAEFRQEFESGSAKDHVDFIISKITPDHMLYLFKDGWDAISFNLIFHDGIRANAAEDKLRLELKEFIITAGAVLLYDVFQFCFQIPTKTAIGDFNHRQGRKEVAANYAKAPTEEPLARFSKSLGRLPAAPLFEMKKKVVKAKIAADLPDAEGW